MKVSTLQIGLCVSLGIHAGLGGVIVFGGWGRQDVLLPPSEQERIVSVTFVTEPEEPLVEALGQPAQVVAVVPTTEVQPEPYEPVATEAKLRESPVIEPLVQPPPPPPQLQPAVSVQSEMPRAPAANQAPLALPALQPTTNGLFATRSSDGAGTSDRARESTVRRPAVPGIRARPAYLKNPEPPYPLSARRRRQEGTVLLNVRVDSQGRATRVELKQSSGVSALDEAAIQAARGWEFTPARIGSTAVEDEAEVPVRFKLTQ